MQAMLALLSKMRTPAAPKPAGRPQVLTCCVCHQGSKEALDPVENWRCESCVRRQEACAVCGDKSTNQVCGECIKRGFQGCQWCLTGMPIPGTTVCRNCATGTKAADFADNYAPENTRDDLGGVLVIPHPGQAPPAGMSRLVMG